MDLFHKICISKGSISTVFAVGERYSDVRQQVLNVRFCSMLISPLGQRQKNKGMSWISLGSRALSLLKVAENDQWQQLWFPAQTA